MSSQKPSGQTNPELRTKVLADYYLAEPGGAPKADRLYQAFLRMIERGYWYEGDKIPAELVLTRALPVGLATVQIALRRLSDEGLIVRKRKAGSFIADPDNIGRELFFFQFLGEGDQRYLPLIDTSLTIEKTGVGGAWSDFLGKHESFLRIGRIIEVDSDFLMLSEMYLSNPKFDALLDIPVPELTNVNFRNVFRDRFGVRSAKSDRRISFVQLAQGQAALLGCEDGLPALQYDVLQYTLKKEPLFFLRTIIPQNNRVLQVASVD